MKKLKKSHIIFIILGVLILVLFTMFKLGYLNTENKDSNTVEFVQKNELIINSEETVENSYSKIIHEKFIESGYEELSDSELKLVTNNESINLLQNVNSINFDESVILDKKNGCFTFDAGFRCDSEGAFITYSYIGFNDGKHYLKKQIYEGSLVVIINTNTKRTFNVGENFVFVDGYIISNKDSDGASTVIIEKEGAGKITDVIYEPGSFNLVSVHKLNDEIVIGVNVESEKINYFKIDLNKAFEKIEKEKLRKITEENDKKFQDFLVKIRGEEVSKKDFNELTKEIEDSFIFDIDNTNNELIPEITEKYDDGYLSTENNCYVFKNNLESGVDSINRLCRGEYDSLDGYYPRNYYSPVKNGNYYLINQVCGYECWGKIIIDKENNKLFNLAESVNYYATSDKTKSSLFISTGPEPYGDETSELKITDTNSYSRIYYFPYFIKGWYEIDSDNIILVTNPNSNNNSMFDGLNDRYVKFNLVNLLDTKEPFKESNNFN